MFIAIKFVPWSVPGAPGLLWGSKVGLDYIEHIAERNYFMENCLKNVEYYVKYLKFANA